MKKYFLSLDLEEWYHLEYVKRYRDKIASTQSFVPQVVPFLKKMADADIFLTVFVLGEVAETNARVVSQISEMGHEIACHGHSHELVYELSNNQFKARTEKAKKILEDITGSHIQGYRAPCFSMENEKLDLLWEMGFVYDASLIRFREHKLYNVMDMSTFEKMESLIFKKGETYEFETPTLDILGRSIPISGGGYFRLFPLGLMKWFMKKHWQNEDNFVFYIHPFELSRELLWNGKRMGHSNYFRFQVGRNNLQIKLADYITWLKQNKVEFMRFKDYIEYQTRSVIKGVV